MNRTVRTAALVSTTVPLAAAVAVAAADLGQATAQAAAAAEAHVAPVADNGQRSATRVATAWAAAWSGTDPQALAGLFTADGVYVDLALDRTFTGRPEVAAWKAGTDTLIANVHVTVLNAFRDGDQVAIETVYSGQLRGAPRPFAVRSTTILLLRHGQITSNTDNYSLATLLAQSGLPADWTPPQG